MTTLARNRIPLSEGLFSFGASSAATKVSALAKSALSDLASTWSFSPSRHELFGLHLNASRGISGSLDEQTLMIADNFLTAMPKHLPAAELSLDEDGEVLFDWSPGPGRMLTVSLRCDGRLSYAVRFGAGRTRYGEDIFTGTFPTWISDDIEKLVA